MRVIVCGAGRVGYGIAETLAAEDHDVSVIDVSADLVRDIRDSLDVRGVVGHGAHPATLEAAGAAEADMLIAVTRFDEVNMTACEVGHALFEVPTKIARIRAEGYLKPHYLDLFSRGNLSVDVIISPELEVGETVLRRIALPGASDIVRFADDAIAMLAVTCMAGCQIAGSSLRDLTTRFPDLTATIVGISRAGVLNVPRSADRLEPGDLAYVVAARDDVGRTLGLFGHDERKAARVVIAGGGTVGFHVARGLEKAGTGTRATIIETSRERAAMIADDLRRTIVLQGSALDRRMLVEAGIADADLIVALTDDDRVNLLAPMLARKLGCRSSLVLLNDPDLQELTSMPGIDAYVNPRGMTISGILRHVRRGRIRAVHSIEKGAAEIVEAEALDTSPLVAAPLRELELPPGVRIGAVYRDGKVLRPHGALRIRPKDRVVMLAAAESVKEVEHLFRVSLEFF